MGASGDGKSGHKSDTAAGASDRQAEQGVQDRHTISVGTGRVLGRPAELVIMVRFTS